MDLRCYDLLNPAAGRPGKVNPNRIARYRPYAWRFW
jgi:hypothetical protein